MLLVIVACLPGIMVSCYFYGLGIIINIMISVTASLAIESLCLKLRHKNVLHGLTDLSAIVSAILLALCLPPYFGLSKIIIGAVFAIVVAKHLYGGLGHNIFNPAMVGYLVLLVAFPQDFSNWQLSENINNFTLLDLNIDALSQATPLDPIYSANNNIIITYIINISWLLGGIYLLSRKFIPIALPAGFLAGIFVASSLAYIVNSDLLYNPVQHLFLGSTMMAAFFIITDPVTASTTRKGRWLYSISAGLICFIIREFGGYPDGVGFAVLFMNFLSPLINKITIDKAYVKN